MVPVAYKVCPLKSGLFFFSPFDQCGFHAVMGDEGDEGDGLSGHGWHLWVIGVSMGIMAYVENTEYPPSSIPVLMLAADCLQ